MSSKSRSRSARRHNPLADDLVATGNLRVKSNKRKAKPEDNEDRFMDSRSSRKILKIGQELVDEDQKENEPVERDSAFAFESRLRSDSESVNEFQDDDHEAWGDEEEDVFEEVAILLIAVGVVLLTCLLQEVDPNDLDLYNRFMPPRDELDLQPTRESSSQDEEGTNLADLILEKIAAHEATTASRPIAEGEGAPEDVELPPKVVEVYSK